MAAGHARDPGQRGHDVAAGPPDWSAGGGLPGGRGPRSGYIRPGPGCIMFGQGTSWPGPGYI
jgi:hypothetical protein